jgi:hypothetical protein
VGHARESQTPGAELRAALKVSWKEESAGKGRRFRTGREAMRSLEN